MTDAQVPPATVLSYARPAGSAAGDIVVHASAEGVLLRVRKPAWLAELVKGFFYLVGVVAVGAVIFLVIGTGRELRSGGLDPTAYVCMILTAAIWLAFAVQLLIVLRTLSRMLRRDPRVGTRFFPAADAEPTWRVDPVKSIAVDREPMQVNFRRPYVLRIKTRRGMQFPLLRGRPPEELEAVATELRTLLRLDAVVRGFPVLPITEKM